MNRCEIRFDNAFILIALSLLKAKISNFFKNSRWRTAFAWTCPRSIHLKRLTCTVRTPLWFSRMGCILAQSGKYDWPNVCGDDAALCQTRMWANAQRDGGPAEYRWRPLFNAAKFGWRRLYQNAVKSLPRRETVEIRSGAPNYRTDLSR